MNDPRYPLLSQLGLVADDDELRKAVSELNDPELTIPPRWKTVERFESLLYEPEPQPGVTGADGGYVIPRQYRPGIEALFQHGRDDFAKQDEIRQAAENMRQKQLESLTPDERAFVRAALAGEIQEGQLNLWDALADYLLDKDWDAETCGRIRGMRSLLVIKAKLEEVRDQHKEAGEQAIAAESNDDMRDWLRVVDQAYAKIELLHWLLGLEDAQHWLNPAGYDTPGG